MTNGTRMDKGNGLKIVVVLIILSILLFLGALAFGIYWDSFRNVEHLPDPND